MRGAALWERKSILFQALGLLLAACRGVATGSQPGRTCTMLLQIKAQMRSLIGSQRVQGRRVATRLTMFILNQPGHRPGLDPTERIGAGWPVGFLETDRRNRTDPVQFPLCPVHAIIGNGSV